MCMSMRGVGKLGAITTSFAYKGTFKTDRDLRMEFLVSIKVKREEGEEATTSVSDLKVC
jgi:GTP cyclohydrolase I